MSIPQIATVALTAPGPAPRRLLLVGSSLGTTATTLWGRCAEALAARYDVVGWELPGHGTGAPATAPFTMAELTAGVLHAADRVLRERGATGAAFDYAGDSIGGAVGLQLLLDHPDRVVHATLIATGARIFSPAAWIERAALVRAEGTGVLLDSAPARWFAPSFAQREPATVAALLGALGDAEDESYALACEALAAFDVRARLGEITRPFLAIAGAHDVSTPPDSLAAIVAGASAAARLVVLEDAAHLPPAELPEQVAAAMLREPATVDEVTAAGFAVRRAVLGEAHVARAAASTTEFGADFQELITQYAWGSIWTRPGLDRRNRSLITLTALVALGHHEELALHVAAALRNGLTRAEIAECLLQTAIYCGVPAANAAFRVADRVLEQLAESAQTS